MRGKIYQPFFLEEGIAGDVGIVYHRTGFKALYKAYQILGLPQGSLADPNDPHGNRVEEIEKVVMPAIAKNGLIISPGMYGPPAVYNTYSIKSQLNGRMTLYGVFIIKSQTKLSHVLIFDQDQAKKMFGVKNSSIYDQISLFGAPATDLRVLLNDKHLKSLIDAYLAGKSLSSEVAAYLSTTAMFGQWVQKGIVKGIVYTGSSDGKCLIVYDHDLLIPRAYALSTQGMKLETPWKSFEKLTSADYQAMKTNKLNIQTKHKTTYDINDPEIKKARELVSAIEKGNAEAILSMFEQKYISPFAYWNGQPFFFMIVDRINDADLIRYIVNTYDFNINLKEKSTGKCALTFAIEKNHKEMFDGLLTVKLLSPNIADNNGDTSFHLSIIWAVSNPEHFMYYFEKLLNDSRTNINLPRKQDRETPLMMIQRFIRAGYKVKVAQDMELMLKKKGAK